MKEYEIFCLAYNLEESNVTHSYNKEIAMAIIMESKQYYMRMFAELKETVEREWLNGLEET
ncbi:MAG: hypothetical protein E7579_03560 [Ruminococcaceae bacterium]|nr:hypothetical protein [Oscillospiraceae bacterium]